MYPIILLLVAKELSEVSQFSYQITVDIAYKIVFSTRFWIQYSPKLISVNFSSHNGHYTKIDTTD